jgi:hypothetical protein
MSLQPVTLELPEEIYERIRQIAEDSNRSLETVLMDSLALLFGEDVELSPDRLNTLSDEQLWALVHRRFAWPLDTRLRALTDLGKRGALSEDEETEMAQLVDAIDRYVLLRSQALLLLKQRGHDVEHHLQSGA